MRRLFDNFICILVTLCMFAFPVLLLGLAPWIGDSVLGGLHLHFGRGIGDLLKAVGLMMGSVGGLMLLAVPVFALVLMGLGRAARFSHRMVSAPEAARPALQEVAEHQAVPVAARHDERGRARKPPAEQERPRVIRQDMRGRTPARAALRPQRPAP